MNLILPPGKFSAYLFDCDGTIADTMGLHYQAWMAALAPWKCDFPRELFYATAGMPIVKTIELLNQRNGLHMPAEVVAQKREAAYFQFLPRIQTVASVEEIIRRDHGKLPFAVVSGSPHESVVKTLTTLKLLEFFPVILGAEDYDHGKPSPEPYLTAAKQLGVAPEGCLVFEDADLGIQSAINAGMKWVRIPQSE